MFGLQGAYCLEQTFVGPFKDKHKNNFACSQHRDKLDLNLQD